MRKMLFVMLILSVLFCTANACSDRQINYNQEGTPGEPIAKEGDKPPDSKSHNPSVSKPSQSDSMKDQSNLIDIKGSTIKERFPAPEGFNRTNTEAGSFGDYLRHLPLKPHGSKVLHYDGTEKKRKVYQAVVDMDIGNRDLQQCADAVMRLRAEYLYGLKLYDKIHFNFTNGFRCDYSKWAQGFRVSVKGNNATWVKRSGPSTDYKSFRKYLDIIFSYAGTLSLSKELISVPVEEMRIGDIFIQGGSPGHCVIVVDMAQNPDTGEKIFMLAQSYMPAQDIHILKNPRDAELSPWYTLTFGEVLVTPEWVFNRSDLKRFPD